MGDGRPRWNCDHKDSDLATLCLACRAKVQSEIDALKAQGVKDLRRMADAEFLLDEAKKLLQELYDHCQRANASQKLLDTFDKVEDFLSGHQKRDEANAKLDAANTQIREALFALGRFEIQGCPCGARPETPNSHPHVLGCHIEEAIVHLEGRASQKQRKEGER